MFIFNSSLLPAFYIYVFFLYYYTICNLLYIYIYMYIDKYLLVQDYETVEAFPNDNGIWTVLSNKDGALASSTALVHSPKSSKPQIPAHPFPDSLNCLTLECDLAVCSPMDVNVLVANCVFTTFSNVNIVTAISL